MATEIIAPVLRFLGLGKFGLAKLFHTSNSEEPTYLAVKPATSEKIEETLETSAISPLLAIAGLFEKYPELIDNKIINSLIEREDSASLWEIIEAGFSEGIIPSDDFANFKARYESLNKNEIALGI